MTQSKVRKFKRRGANSGTGRDTKLKQMLEQCYNDLKTQPEVLGRTPIDVLIGIRFDGDHFHGLYPKKDEMTDWILNELFDQNSQFETDEDDDSVVGAEIKEGEVFPIRLPKQIVFHNRQAIGDILMFTCAVRDFARAYPEVKIAVESTAMHIWDHNPYLSDRKEMVEVVDPQAGLTKTQLTPQGQRVFVGKAIEEGRPVKLYIGPSKATNQSNTTDTHFANAYRMSMEDVLGVKIKQGPIKPDVYMIDEEVREPLIKQPYWLITAGEKGDWTAKTWPNDWWQEIVNQMPNVTFVQIGAAGHKHTPLVGDNVINYIGKTDDKHKGIRDLFNLFYFCQGSIGMVSFHMHLAAAFGKPCVVIAGAREPSRFTHYPGHRYLSTDGCLPCTVNGSEPRACWYCDVDRCEHMEVVMDSGQKVPLCMMMITPEDVVGAMRKYYEGKRLSYTSTSTTGSVSTIEVKVAEEVNEPASISANTSRTEAEKVKESTIDAAKAGASLRKVMAGLAEPTPAAAKALEEAGLTHSKNPVKPWGFEWGGTSITEPDWEFMKGIFNRYNVKLILEFGCGLSTLLMNDYGIQTISYEADRYEAWSTEVKEKNPNLDIREWDAKSDIRSVIGGKFDLCFVDGPSGSQRRDVSIEIASRYANLIIVHDAGRKIDMEYQVKYLEPTFELMDRGGTRCHFWKRKPVASWNKHLEKDKPEEEGKVDIGPGRQIVTGTRVDIEQNVTTGELIALPTRQAKVRMVFNGGGEGGAERSTTWLMKTFVDNGYDVEYVTPKGPSGTFRKTKGLEKVRVLEATKETITAETDLLILYCNDWIWEFKTLEMFRMFDEVKAKRKVMVVNYRLGNIGKIPWTKGWDKYLFLNRGLMNSLMKAMPMQSSTSMAVLPPPTDLTDYFKIKPHYGGNMRIVRHSSQGDTKYSKDFDDRCFAILDRRATPGREATISLMPAPSTFYEMHYENCARGLTDRIFRHKRNQPPVPEFLSLGNVFWYWLPQDYHDQGPKVIMEAQAAGLPVVAQDHSGPRDRVVNGSGYLSNDFKDHLEFLHELENPRTREEIGKLGREHAWVAYDPKWWIEEMLS